MSSCLLSITFSLGSYLLNCSRPGKFELGGGNFSTVFALLQLLHHMTHSPDVTGQRQVAVNLRHSLVNVHHDTLDNSIIKIYVEISNPSLPPQTQDGRGQPRTISDSSWPTRPQQSMIKIFSLQILKSNSSLSHEQHRYRKYFRFQTNNNW